MAYQRISVQRLSLSNADGKRLVGLLNDYQSFVRGLTYKTESTLRGMVFDIEAEGPTAHINRLAQAMTGFGVRVSPTSVPARAA